MNGGPVDETVGSTGGAGGPRDRRANPRASIEIPALMHVGTREVACTVRDLSTQGIALTLKESVAPGMVVRVVFRLPNARQPVEVAGVLVRSAGARNENTIGLQFVEPNADAVRTIETFVDRNRSDLPFSGRDEGQRDAAGPDTARIDVSESAASLKGLYQKAVDEVTETEGRRRGLLGRRFGRKS